MPPPRGVVLALNEFDDLSRIKTMSIGLDEADRVSAGEPIPVLGQRVVAELEVRERLAEEVLLQEAAGVGREATGAHVNRARARVQAAVVEAVGVERARVVVVAGEEPGVALAVGAVAVGRLRPARPPAG